MSASFSDAIWRDEKSDPSDMSRINLTDDAETIMSKVRKAKTDPEPLPDTIEGLEGRPEARNLVGIYLVGIYAAMTDATPADVLATFGGQGFGTFKPALGELLAGKLGPIAARLKALKANPDELDAILAKSTIKARALAAATLAAAYKAMGL